MAELKIISMVKLYHILLVRNLKAPENMTLLTHGVIYCVTNRNYLIARVESNVSTCRCKIQSDKTNAEFYLQHKLSQTVMIVDDSR